MGSCSTYRSAGDLQVLPDCAESPASKSSDNFDGEYSVRVEVYDTEVTATSSTDSSPIIKISGLHTTGGIVRLCSSTHFLTGNIIPALRQPLQCRALCSSNNKSLPNLRYHGKWKGLTPERISSPEIQCKEHKSSHTVVPQLGNETNANNLNYTEEKITSKKKRSRTSCRTFVLGHSAPHAFSETLGVPKKPPVAPARKPKATANFRQHAAFEDKKATVKCMCTENVKEPQFSLFSQNEWLHNSWDKEAIPKTVLRNKVHTSYRCPHPHGPSCDKDMSTTAFNLECPCFSELISCHPLQEVQNDCSMYFQSTKQCKNSQTELNCFEEVVTTRVVPAASSHHLKCKKHLKDACTHQNLDSCYFTERSTTHGTTQHRTKHRSTLPSGKVQHKAHCKHHGHDMLVTSRRHRADSSVEATTRTVPIVCGLQHGCNAKHTAHKATQTLPMEEPVSPILTSLVEWLTITCQNFMSRFSNIPGIKSLQDVNPVTVGKSFQNLLAHDASFWTNLVKQIHDGITGFTKPSAEPRHCRRRTRKCTIPDSNVIVMAANITDNLRAASLFNSIEGMKGEGEHVTLKCCDPKQVLRHGQCLPKRTLSHIDLSTLREEQVSVEKVVSKDGAVQRKYWSCLKF